MKIVVTGSSGRIGGAVCRELVEWPDVTAVHGVDRVPGVHTQTVLDLGAAPGRQKALRGVLSGASAVVHCAALHAPQVGVAPDAEFLRVNIAGTRALLDAAAGVLRLIYTSTTALYGAGAQAARAGSAVWVDEDTVPAPQTIYHRSKLAAETLLREAAAQGGPKLCILRMSRCFAEPPAAMAVQRLHRGVDARDVARAHALAIGHATAQAPVFNLSGATPFRPQDLAALWHEAPVLLRQRAPALAAAFDARGWPLPARIDRVYDSGRAQAALGWQPLHGWADALRDGPGAGPGWPAP